MNYCTSINSRQKEARKSWSEIESLAKKYSEYQLRSKDQIKYQLSENVNVKAYSIWGILKWDCRGSVAHNPLKVCDSQ